MKTLCKYPAATLAALGVATLLPTLATAEQTITVKGSDTMVILGQKWAETYMRTHPGITVQVTGGGSGTGISALLNGTTQICNSSRPMKPAEIAEFVKRFKKRPQEFRVCLDGLSIFVHRDCPVAKISIPQLEAIFTGRVTNWNAIGGPDSPISLYGRENSSGTYEFFKEHVLQKKDFAATTKTMPGTAAVIQAVAKDAPSIGYGGIAYAEGVKILPVSATDNTDAIQPDQESVLSGKYPISRALFNYVAPTSESSPVNAYIQWCLSEEGQALVKEVGYFPLPQRKQ
jgi:phosphate transport system substrate-binding protein